MLLHPPVWADCVSQKLWVYVWGSSQLWPSKSPPVRCSQVWGNPCWKVGMRCTENPSWGADLYLVLSSLPDGPGLCAAISALARPFPLSWETGWASQVTRTQESTTEERIFGEQCFMSGIPSVSLALTAPRKGSCKAMVASCIASQPPGVLGAERTLHGRAVCGVLRAPAGEAAWPQADAGVGAAVGRRAGEPGGLSLMWWALGPAPSWPRGRNWTVGRNGEGLFTLARDGGRWSDRYNVEA